MPSESKKPPALEHYTQAYEIPYISQMKYLFSFKGILSKGDNTENRESFEKYPIFLKHSLFHNEEKMKKIRGLEVAHRFFIYDKFREKGNKNYNKKNFEEALGLYEHALSCFKWLEFKECEKKEDDEEAKEEYDPLATLKPMNKALCSIISDDNIELHDGQEITDSCEKDMRQSMVLNICLALSVCYLNMYHFSTALEACEDGMKVAPGSSQIYFRRSQCRAYNKLATLADLQLAKQDIEKAIELKHYEKLFQSEPNMLKLLNLHNAGEIYVEHAHFVEKLIKEKKTAEKEAIGGLLSRAREIGYIEETLINEGKIPKDTDDSHCVDIQTNDEENMEYDVVKEMVNKYLKVIEFYQETDKKDQVQIARKEIQGVLELYSQMKFYYHYDFSTYQTNEIFQELNKEFNLDLSQPKTMRRLNRLKLNKAKELFENGHFNLEMFQYAVKDYFKRKQEKEEKKKEKEKEKQLAVQSSKPWTQRMFGNIFNLEFALQICIIMLLFVVFWYFNKGSLISPNMFWK